MDRVSMDRGSMDRGSMDMSGFLDGARNCNMQLMVVPDTDAQ